MTYAQKLKDPRWKVRRLEIIKAFNGKCAHCDSTNRIEVHHINYRKDREPWEYRDSELMCLCRNCHELVESEVIPDLRGLVMLVPGHTLFGVCELLGRSAESLKTSNRDISIVSILEEAAHQARSRDIVRRALESYGAGADCDYIAIADQVMEGQR